MLTFRDYELCGEIGHGGMGVVYRAKHRFKGSEYALKVLRDRFSNQDELNKRFLREASTLNQLNHPNILNLIDVFEEDDQLVIITPLLKGDPLDVALSRKKIVSYEQGNAWLEQIVAGVAYAHDNGIVHRDLKPSNIFIEDNDIVKILDFGLCKRLTDDNNMTATGQVIGTPAYLPPETMRRKGKISLRDIGPVGDVFALGVLGYRIFSGQLPYGLSEKQSSIETLTDLALRYNQKEPIPDLSQFRPDLPSAFSRLIMQCLSHEGSDRPADARQMHQLLVGDLQISYLDHAAEMESLNAIGISVTGQETYFKILKEKRASSSERIENEPNSTIDSSLNNASLSAVRICCPACGEYVDGESRYCPMCGAGIPQKKTRADSPSQASSSRISGSSSNIRDLIGNTNPIEYYLRALKRFATFSGRASRSEFWFFHLFNGIIALTLITIGVGTRSKYILWTGLAYFITTLVPTMAVSFRRMHDINKPGWYSLLPFYSVVLAATRGDTQKNNYGKIPR